MLCIEIDIQFCRARLLIHWQGLEAGGLVILHEVGGSEVVAVSVGVWAREGQRITIL